MPARAEERPALASLIRRYPLAVATLATLLPLALMLIVTTAEAVRAYRAQDEQRLRVSADAVAAALDARLGSIGSGLGALALHPSLAAALPEGGEELAAFNRWAAPFAQRFGARLLVMGAPPGFETLSSSLIPEEAAARTPTARSPAIQLATEQLLGRLRAEGEIAVSDLYIGPLSGRPALFVATLVRRQGQGQTLGALAFAFEAGRLTQGLGFGLSRDGTFVSLVDGNGNILVDHTGTGGPAIGAQAPAWLLPLLRREGRGTAQGVNLEGREGNFVFRRLEHGWFVIAGQSGAARNRALLGAAAWLGATLVMLAAAVAGLIWAHRRQVRATARQEARALLAGRAEVQRLHAGLPAVIFLRDVAPDGSSRLLYRGGDLETVTGWPADYLAGRADWADLYERNTPQNLPFYQAVLRDGSTTQERQMRQPGGGWRWLRLHGRCLNLHPDGGGEVVGYLMDIDAEKRAAARVVAAGRLAALGEMAAGLAHELRQPLQAIMMLSETAEMAARRGDLGVMEQRLAMVTEQTERAGRIIDNLRRFSRGTPEQAELEPVPVEEAVRRTLAIAEGPLREAKVMVELALGEPPPVVRGHQISLEQVLLNLVLNARDAMSARPRQAPRRLRIAACRAGGEVRLEVADTGGGIAPAVLNRLFEPFTTTKDPEKGTGLGLSISRGLVQAMGGRIEARNEGEGAVFAITLPLQPAG